MKIAFFINTAAQAHFFKNIIGALTQKGHDLIVLARNYGETLYLLRTFNLPHVVYSHPPASKYGKILVLPSDILSAYRYLRKSGVTLIVGTGIYSVYTALLLKRPNLLFMDAISTRLELSLTRRFADVIVTPSNLTADLGQKHIRINSFKELAYLHPAYFHPDRTMVAQLPIAEGKKFVVLRFNAFDATHDFGIGGFGRTERRELVHELSKHGQVFISSEAPVSNDLNEYVLRVPRERIHHVLYYADLLIADTGTMVTEAALLGTPAICYHPKARKIGNFIELEEHYELILTFQDMPRLIEKAIGFLTQKGLKEEWKARKEKLIREKIDMTLFMTWFIENYPESLKTMQRDPAYQKVFTQVNPRNFIQ